MKIRITKAFSGYRVGQEFDWADGMARIYIGRGMAEEIVEPAAAGSTSSVEEKSEDMAIEHATASPKVERATMPAKRRQPK